MDRPVEPEKRDKEVKYQVDQPEPVLHIGGEPDFPTWRGEPNAQKN